MATGPLCPETQVVNGPSQPDFAAALLRPPTWKALVANQQLLCGLLSYRENRG